MKYLCLLLLAVLPCVAHAQPSNPELSITPLRNGEPFLAVNPTNPENIVVAWMSLKITGMTIATRASFDGGATWGDTIQLPHEGPLWGSADVSMAWRRDGVLFLSYIDYRPNTDSSGGVFVTRSTDGGESWSVPIKAIDALADTDVSLDRPWIAVDNSNTSTFGNLYLPTKPAPWNPLPNHAYFTRSTDGGSTWAPEVMLDSAPYLSTNVQQPMGSPAVASDGTLYIAYPCLGLKSGYALATSHDGGASFARSFIVTPIPSLAEKDSAKQAFQLIADPSNAKHLLFAWPDNRNGDLDVYASASFDGGGTWSAPVRVNDDAVGNGVEQDMLWGAFNSSGTAAIVWRDRRNGTPDGDASACDVYYSSSTDGGMTWSKNYRLSSVTAPYNSILVDAGNDFMSSAIAGDTLFAAWGDTRTDSLRIYFAKSKIGAASGVSVTRIASTPVLSVQPNPASTMLHINFFMQDAGTCSVSLYNESGALVNTYAEGELAEGMQSVSVPLTELANGNHFAVIHTPAGTLRAKFTVQR